MGYARVPQCLSAGGCEYSHRLKRRWRWCPCSSATWLRWNATSRYHGIIPKHAGYCCESVASQGSSAAREWRASSSSAVPPLLLAPCVSTARNRIRARVNMNKFHPETLNSSKNVGLGFGGHVCFCPCMFALKCVRGNSGKYALNRESNAARKLRQNALMACPRRLPSV